MILTEELCQATYSSPRLAHLSVRDHNNRHHVSMPLTAPGTNTAIPFWKETCKSHLPDRDVHLGILNLFMCPLFPQG